MKVTDRASLAAYCLRRLGQPLIKIEVAAEQIDDRIDEALETFFEKHVDASVTRWFAYKVTAKDIESQSIKIPDDIQSVNAIAPVTNGYDFYSEFAGTAYDPTLKAIDTAYGLSSGQYADPASMFITVQYTSMLRDMWSVTPKFSYNKLGRTLFVQSDLHRYTVGSTFLFEAQQMIDPELVYNSKWVKQFTEALIKRQWASNLQKFKGSVLMGGMVINASEIYEQAQAEIDRLEIQLNTEYRKPVLFIRG